MKSKITPISPFNRYHNIKFIVKKINEIIGELNNE